jgi:hypothetical protein
MLRLSIAVKVIDQGNKPALEGRCRHLQEDIMVKRSVFLALGIAALTAMSWSDAANARLASNGIKLSNGIRMPNGLKLPNSMEISTTALQPVRLALPDGTEVNFR